MDFASKEKYLRIAFISGVVAHIIGVFDPMEGSVVIAIGSVLLAFVSYHKSDKHRKWFFATSAMILFGVFFLFFYSSLGGIGGNSGRPLWWGITILTYPLGWLINIVVLIVRAINRKKVSVNA